MLNRCRNFAEIISEPTNSPIFNMCENVKINVKKSSRDSLFQLLIEKEYIGQTTICVFLKDIVFLNLKFH